MAAVEKQGEDHMSVEGTQFRFAVAPIMDVQVRDASETGDGSWTVGGYAAVFDTPTTIFDGKYVRCREMISPGAFTRAVKNQRSVMDRVGSGDEVVALTYRHDRGSIVASTRVRQQDDGGALPIGGLELTEDSHGLRFFARVDTADPDAQRMAVKLRRGVVNQASFAFTVADENVEYGRVGEREDEFHRVDEVSNLYDVCVAPDGAYPETESWVRTMAAQITGRGDLPGLAGREGFSGRASVAACPNCGATNAYGAKFCPDCGTSMQMGRTGGGLLVPQHALVKARVRAKAEARRRK